MIDKDLAAFLQEGVAIQLGTRNERLEPNGVRVAAARVEDDGRHVVAFVPEDAVRQVLPDLEANGQAALVFARPIDDRACQVKGVFTGARATTSDEDPLIAEQWEGLLRYFEMIGLPRALVGNWRNSPCVAIRIRVTSLFSQTPGPGAGAPLS